MTDHASHDLHEPSYYVKIWVVLCILLAVSILGPMLEVQVLTLITAFGIACVKAYLVASRFMHLNIEKRIASVMIVSALAFMVLFFFGVAPDVMRHEGQNWENEAARAEVARALKAAAEAPDAHGGGEHH